MRDRKLKVGISQGDANGISYEVIIKALSDERILEMCTPVIYGSSKIFGYYKSQIHNLENMGTHNISSGKDAHHGRINIVNCLSESVFAEPGIATSESAKNALIALEKAVDELKAGYIDVLVTAPFNKHAMAEEGFRHSGHTDYLQEKFGAKDALMIMVSENLKIGVATAHIPLSEVPSKLSIDSIAEKIRIMNRSLKQDFRIDSPKIAILGLNPHCGDGGLLGKEEQEIIIPAVRKVIDEGIYAYGPYSPDGFFGLGNYRKYDAILAMYHDQGLIPFKTLAFEEGVNFTAGLPVVRTSPDHGTAFEMAGRDEANPMSMRSSIYTAIDIYWNRQEYAKMQKDKLVEPEEKPWEPRDRKKTNIE